MKSKSVKKIMLLAAGSIACLCVGTVALAATSGIGGVAAQVTSNLSNVAKFVTAASYVAGMAFAIAAVLKFKAHKDNPTQVTISMGISLLFVSAALIFLPAVFQASGGTLFGASGTVAGVSGITTFGASKAV
jgi:intracellular multiplication protein IcmD